MIFEAPAYDGRVHLATIEGKEVSLVRCSAGGDNLVINATEGNRRSIINVGLVDGKVDTDAPLDLSITSYETFLKVGFPPHNSKEICNRDCAVVLGLFAVLSNFPEISLASPPKTVLSPEQIAQINEDLD